MRKVILGLLIFFAACLLLIRLGYRPLMEALGLTPRAGIRVEASQKANVFLDNQDKGATPFQEENLKEGEHLISLKQVESSSAGQILWQGYVKLNGGTLTVVNREIAQSQTASSGEVITLEKGRGVTIVSTPSNAEVSIDGKVWGRTPISISELATGEHQFFIGKDSFLKRSIRATLVEGYNLTLNVDLALAEADLSQAPTIAISSPSQVVIKSTPTGFLRVRSTPDLNGAEVGRVAPGETLTLLEELPNWDKIRLPDGKGGYVSSSYVEKKSQ